MGLATRTIRANTSQLLVPKRQDKHFIHIRASNKNQPLLSNSQTKYLMDKAMFLLKEDHWEYFYLGLRSSNIEVQKSSQINLYNIRCLFIPAILKTLFILFIYWVRLSHMTPDINTAQITLVAQTEFDSGMQWLYVPCVCVCVFNSIFCVWLVLNVKYVLGGKDTLRWRRIRLYLTIICYVKDFRFEIDTIYHIFGWKRRESKVTWFGQGHKSNWW